MEINRETPEPGVTMKLFKGKYDLNITVQEWVWNSNLNKRTPTFTQHRILAYAAYDGLNVGVACQSTDPTKGWLLSDIFGRQDSNTIDLLLLEEGNGPEPEYISVESKTTAGAEFLDKYLDSAILWTDCLNCTKSIEGEEVLRNQSLCDACTEKHPTYFEGTV
jgi:hypothetical protein